jgi:hypothetical protein
MDKMVNCQTRVYDSESRRFAVYSPHCLLRGLRLMFRRNFRKVGNRRNILQPAGISYDFVTAWVMKIEMIERNTENQ